MALPNAELEALRDALLKARASGTKLVQHSDGRRVEYKTDSEMAAAIHDIEARIRRASAAPAGAIRFKASKGF